MAAVLAMFLATFLAMTASRADAADFGPLKGQVFERDGRAVVVFLHGDVSGGGPAEYHVPLMRDLAANLGVTAIALLRPGYSDGTLTSPGTNHERRDQYTVANNDLLARTLSEIRAAYPGKRLVVAGHSGGAAQLGAVIGRYPRVVDSAILISCPCDIGAWRAASRPFPRSERQSPMDFADRIGTTTHVVAITGVNDTNTWPGLGEAYIAKASAAGTPARFQAIAGADHWNRALRAAAFNVIQREVTR